MILTRPLLRVLAVLALLNLAACASTPSVNTPEVGPLRLTPDATDANLMLRGHDAVAYFTENAAVKGDPAIKLEHLGATWRFASAANRDAFRKDPARYMPQFGGWCSNGINYAIPGGAGGETDSWRIYRGKLYVFGGKASRDQFEIDTELNLERAHRYWREEVAGSSPRLQRWKRMTFRVPHYKSDAQLQAEWEAMRAAGTLPVMPGARQVVSAEP